MDLNRTLRYKVYPRVTETRKLQHVYTMHIANYFCPLFSDKCNENGATITKVDKPLRQTACHNILILNTITKPSCFQPHVLVIFWETTNKWPPTPNFCCTKNAYILTRYKLSTYM